MDTRKIKLIPAALLCFIALANVWAVPAQGHALAPSLLEVTHKEMDSNDRYRYAVLWKTPKKNEAGVRLKPRFPKACDSPEQFVTRETSSAFTTEFQVFCNAPIEGQKIRIDDLNFATTNVVLRYIDKQGHQSHWLLSNETTDVNIPLQKTASVVFSDYLALGLEHLIGGLDHVLFVLALLLLVPLGRKLVTAITAFTLGHCITLSLSALKLVTLPQQAVEILIAVSIVIVACECIKATQHGETTWLQRYPGAVTCLFGLIHGLGFAGVLTEIGLPGTDKVLALLAFNLGIELGQLAIVLLWVIVAMALMEFNSRPQFLRHARWQLPMAYSIGTVGAYWVYDRSFSLLGIV